MTIDIGKKVANLLFQLILTRYERRSTIITISVGGTGENVLARPAPKDLRDWRKCIEGNMALQNSTASTCVMPFESASSAISTISLSLYADFLSVCLPASSFSYASNVFFVPLLKRNNLRLLTSREEIVYDLFRQCLITGGLVWQ